MSQSDIYTILCVVDKGDVAFPVEIDKNKTIGLLKEEIIKKNPSYANIDPYLLDLYLVDIPDAQKVELKASVGAQVLDFPQLPSKSLSSIFPTGPKPETVHFIVKTTVVKRKRSNPDVPERSKRRRLQFQSSTIYKTEAEPGKPDAPACLPRQVGFWALTSFYNLIAADKTKYIELLDTDESYQYSFLRPRRWGKTIFLQTLMDYYDKAKKGQFDDIFHDLYIGKHPTSARSSLLVLRFDFSSVSGAGTNEDMKLQFHRTVNGELTDFLRRNQAFLGGPHQTLVDTSDGTKSLQNVLRLVEEREEGLFVGVDEYDAPANTVLFDPDESRYNSVSEFFKTQFFAIMKSSAYKVVKKYWVTGVLPVFRDGISPLSATDIISDKPEYNSLCGFTDSEVRVIAQSYLSEYKLPELEFALQSMKHWYNGYLFSPGKHEGEAESLHNPQLIFNHLRSLAKKERKVAALEEVNAIHMASVLQALPDTGEASFLDTYYRAISNGIVTTVTHQFGAAEVRLLGKDPSATWNILYFFGVLTHTPDGLRLRVPNSTMTSVIYKRFRNFLNRRPQLATRSSEAYGGLLQGEVIPLVELLEKFFDEVPARAVKDCNEAALRTALTVFWSDQAGGCLPELSLLVKPHAQSGEGRSGFLDLFLPCSPSAPCIELKNISLDALWKGQHGPQALSSDNPLEVLRAQLRGDSEGELLNRRVEYGRGEYMTVNDVKMQAVQQITGYLDAMKHGVGSNSSRGVYDWRVKHTEKECMLIGYVVILVGGTRALGWCVTTAQTEVTWEITEKSLI